jgi:hypothetical protein
LYVFFGHILSPIHCKYLYHITSCIRKGTKINPSTSVLLISSLLTL